LVKGDSTNELIEFVADPNVSIQESKVFTVMIEAGRRSRERRVATSGPLVRQIDGRHDLRDLPVAQGKHESKHGYKSQETKEGN
jgi:formate dehydrogenase major subunit